ncbi:MAG: phospholipid/glycerol acyltransferase [Candidatus Magnetoglobus multicellularis str. Araruama]|uniref:Phospholipid/glycerol acyltransferase n=1 Tax=Candidatus Magnetoglobus multicellularis str. Araruama TaxID=890399 RepID=A0A1V1NZH9_9BACT|nr:MAG: phospholipid/glycerol acyltransferase [Candidatus Magnetoglobus multicellularis str. Araruama]
MQWYFFKRYDIDRIDQRNDQLIEKLSPYVNFILRNYFRSTVRGIYRIPRGPGLFVGNHNAALLTPDSYIFATEVCERKGVQEVPYGLGHEITISMPFIHQFLIPLGAVRASHDCAHRLFKQNKKVLVYPGGDYDVMRPFRHRNKIVFGGRKGYIRLAVRENVPVIPVVTAGAHSVYIIIDDMRWLARLLRLDRLFRMNVLPLTLSIPWGLTLGPLPFFIPYPSKISIEILDPIYFNKTGEAAANDNIYVQECATEVESRMQAALDRMVA